MLNYEKSFEEEERERLEELTARACKKERQLRVALSSLMGNAISEHDRFNTICELAQIRESVCDDIRRFEKHLKAVAKGKNALEVIDDE